MSSLDAALVWLDSGVCSQIPSHSFWLAGHQLPLCARDLGLFGAFLLALPFARPGGPLAWLLGLLPLLADGANSLAFDILHASLYQPANSVRFATGALAGACLALTIGRRARPAILVVPLAGMLALATRELWLLPALTATAGAAALAASATALARPRWSDRAVWALALPELALLAAGKSGLLALLR